MNTSKPLRRLLSVALTLCMVLTLLPAISVPARATVTTRTTGLDLSQADGDQSGYGWAWVQIDQTLILTNIAITATDPEAAVTVPDGATVVGEGAVTLSGKYGIQGKGNLTVKGSFESIKSPASKTGITAAGNLIIATTQLGEVDNIHAEVGDVIISGTVGTVGRISATCDSSYNYGNVVITGTTGDIGTLSSSVDAISAENNVTISGKVGTIASGVRAISADGDITISTNVTLIGNNPAALSKDPTLVGKAVTGWSTNSDGLPLESGDFSQNWNTAKYVVIGDSSGDGGGDPEPPGGPYHLTTPIDLIDATGDTRGDGWTWTHATGTLDLSNVASIVTTDDAIWLPAATAFATIIGDGVVITAGSGADYAIGAGGDLTLSGRFGDITGGIYASSKLTLSGSVGDITCTGEDITAINASGDLLINGNIGNITAGGYGITASGNITISEGKTVGNISSGSSGIYAYNKSSTLTISGTVGDITSTAGNGLQSQHINVTATGKVGNLTSVDDVINATRTGTVTIAGEVGDLTSSTEYGILAQSVTISGKLGDITTPAGCGIRGSDGSTVTIDASAQVGNITSGNSCIEAIGDITIAGSVGDLHSTSSGGIYAAKHLNISGTVGTITAEVAGLVSLSSVFISGTVGAVTTTVGDGIGAEGDGVTIAATANIGKVTGGNHGITTFDNGGTDDDHIDNGSNRNSDGQRVLIINAPVEACGVTRAVDPAPTLARGLEVTAWSKNMDGTSPETDPVDWNLAKYVKIEQTSIDANIGGITTPDATYTGSAYVPTGTVTVDAGTVDTAKLVWLYESTDGGGYSSSTAPTNVGAYKLTISVPSSNTDYFGSLMCTFHIDKADIASNTSVSIATSSVYTGRAIKALEGISLNGNDLTENTDFTVSYANNINAGDGTASVTITGIGNLSGSITRSFTIAKAPLTVTAEPKTIAIGDPEPDYTYTVAGLLGDDTKTVVTGVTFALDKTFDSTTADTFVITPSGGSADNYAIAYNTATLTVTACTHKTSKTETTTQPTCIGEGVKTTTCTDVCLAVIATEPVSPLGHSWDNGVVTTPPTATTSGVKTFTCKVCNDTKTETIPATGGGGTNSGGSSSNTIPAEVGSDGVPVEIKTSGNDVTLKLEDSKLDTILKRAEEDVVFDLSGVKKAETAILPIAAAEAFSDAGIAVTLKLPQGSVTLPAKSLAALVEAGSGAVRVEVKSVGAAALSPMQAAQVGAMGTVINVDIFVGDTKVDVPVTINVPYTLKEGEDPAGVCLWFMDDNGNLTKIPSSFDPETALLTATLAHQSLYLIGYDPVALWQNVFGDVQSGTWYYDSVAYAEMNGLFTGYGDGNFGPNDGMTRAMFAQVLWNMDGSPAVTIDNPFSDVEDIWYKSAVLWAYDSGIIAGVGDGRFAPEQKITRQEIMLMLWNYADFKGYDIPVNRDLMNWKDKDSIAPWAQTAVEDLYKAGVISHKGDETVAAKDNATRAEAAAMLHSFMRLVAGK